MMKLELFDIAVMRRRRRRDAHSTAHTHTQRRWRKLVYRITSLNTAERWATRLGRDEILRLRVSLVTWWLGANRSSPPSPPLPSPSLYSLLLYNWCAFRDHFLTSSSVYFDLIYTKSYTARYIVRWERRERENAPRSRAEVVVVAEVHYKLLLTQVQGGS